MHLLARPRRAHSRPLEGSLRNEHESQCAVGGSHRSRGVRDGGGNPAGSRSGSPAAGCSREAGGGNRHHRFAHRGTQPAEHKPGVDDLQRRHRADRQDARGGHPQLHAADLRRPGGPGLQWLERHCDGQPARTRFAAHDRAGQRAARAAGQPLGRNAGRRPGLHPGRIDPTRGDSHRRRLFDLRRRRGGRCRQLHPERQIPGREVHRGIWVLQPSQQQWHRLDGLFAAELRVTAQ